VCAASVVLLEDSSQAGDKLVYLKEPFINGSGTVGAISADCSAVSSSAAGGSNSSASGGSCAKWVKWTRNDGHVFCGEYWRALLLGRSFAGRLLATGSGEPLRSEPVRMPPLHALQRVRRMR
jgi:hypothetical protein